MTEKKMMTIIAVILPISIIVMLYSPRYLVNITFQGAAAKLCFFFSCVFCQVLARFFFYFFMSTSKNYTKTIFTEPEGNNC